MEGLSCRLRKRVRSAEPSYFITAEKVVLSQYHEIVPRGYLNSNLRLREIRSLLGINLVHKSCLERCAVSFSPPPSPLPFSFGSTALPELRVSLTIDRSDVKLYVPNFAVLDEHAQHGLDENARRKFFPPPPRCRSFGCNFPRAQRRSSPGDERLLA